MAVLRDRRHECVAQFLAQMKTPAEASALAGYDTKAKSFKDNARKRACRPDIKGRVTELQGQIAACAIIDVAWIRGKTARIAGVEFDPENIPASVAVTALALLAKMTPGALVPEKVAITDADGGPPPRDLSLTELIARIDAALATVEGPPG